ncbi:MAG: Ig-like domain-containing protein [Acidobacteriota bacterium]|nr:Ig-like domain-containing protein [Acidobacteriota bacterium]
MRRTAALIVLLALAAAGSASTQATQRHVTTAHALARFPVFFHGSHVTFLGTVHSEHGPSVIPVGDKQRVVALWQTPQDPQGSVLLRGMFLDLGRLDPSEPRLANIDVQRILDVVNEGRWPGRDQLFLLTGARSEKYEPPPQASLHAIALDPAAYAGKTVTVAGRFRGKNLLADQPAPPGKSPYEYVVRVADASVWISGLRARGRGFTLDQDSRRDTREWVRITGVVRHEPPLAWIEGKTIELARPETEETAEPPAPLPPGAPPAIIFSAPLDGEDDIPTNVVLRVQFSRDIEPGSLENQVAVAYGLRTDGSAPGPAPAAATTYRAANRSVEIRFAQPLAPFTNVVIAFGNEIKATDGVAMKPARITFTTGR